MNIDRKWLGGLLVIMVIAIPFVLRGTKREIRTQVDFATVARHEIRPTILASGTLAYRTEVNLTSEVVARVQSIAVKEGDVVTAGQVLMTLDPELYRNAIEREEASQRQGKISIERQRATLLLRRKQFERSRKLIAAQMIDQNRFDEDRHQLELAQVELQSSEEALRRANAVLGEAREQLDKTTIRSPLSGTIVSLPIKVGETAIPSTSSLAGAQLVKIADTTAIQAELKVDEADIARVRLGQQAHVYAAAYPDLALKGVVQSIALAPTLEGQGRAYKVTVQIHPPKYTLLRSGMSARADIFLSDQSKKPALPVEAIGSDIGEDKRVTRFVWQVRDGRVHKVTVQTSVSDDRLEAIEKPLAVGDVVVAGPAKVLRTLHEGDLVVQRPKEPKDEALGNDREDRQK